jgi:predicted Zn-dependent protease
MDLQNIATHELGHAVGMADIYTTSSQEVTMYGYSTEGETKKRSLETPDIIGLEKMYGL